MHVLKFIKIRVIDIIIHNTNLDANNKPLYNNYSESKPRVRSVLSIMGP